MKKSYRKSKRHMLTMKQFKNATNKTLPLLDKGLHKVGKTTKTVMNASIPVIEKGVGAVYGTMSSGLDLGMKGVKSVTKRVSLTRHRNIRGGSKRRKYRR